MITLLDNCPPPLPFQRILVSKLTDLSGAMWVYECPNCGLEQRSKYDLENEFYRSREANDAVLFQHLHASKCPRQAIQ